MHAAQRCDEVATTIRESFLVSKLHLESGIFFWFGTGESLLVSENPFWCQRFSREGGWVAMHAAQRCDEVSFPTCASFLVSEIL